MKVVRGRLLRQGVLSLLIGSGLMIFGVAFRPTPAQTTSQPGATDSAPTKPQAAQTSPRVDDERYRLGPGDVLDIRYYNRPQLSREAVRIDGRGMIRMPLIEGEIQAACLTESELAAEIARRYLKYYRNPYVDVFIKEYQAEPVAVIGAVKSPGRFQLQRRVRLLELLAFANGPTERAGRSIQLVHASTTGLCEGQRSGASTDANFVSYDLNETLRGEERANPIILPGDVITLPEADQVYVVGNVYSPKPIPLKEPVTVTRAIAMAGGTMRDTKSDRVRIIRQIPGTATQREIFVDLKAISKQQAEDVLLLPNDIVDVPTSAGKALMRSLLGTIAPAVSQLPVRVIP